MNNRRDWVIHASTIVADSAWLYVAIGILGFLTDQGGSPLPWLAVFALLVAGALAARLVPLSSTSPTGQALIQASVGLAAIYIAMAWGTPVGRLDFDLAWGPRLVAGEYLGVTLVGSVVGVLAGTYLWRRALQIAAEVHLGARLQRSFRSGIVALAAGMVVELLSGGELHAGAMLVPFFAATLTGLAASRLGSGGGVGRAWTSVIALAVAVIVAIGLGLGMIGGAYGGSGIRLLAAGWSYAMDGTLWLIRWLLGPLIELVFEFLEWSSERTSPPEIGGTKSPIEQLWERFGAIGSGPAMADRIVDALQYPMLLIFLFLLYRGLAMSYRGYARQAAPPPVQEREAIEADANMTVDLARMVWELLPEWLKRGRRPAGWRCPEDDPAAVPTFRLYFDMLAAGIRRGHDFDPTETPLERSPGLAVSLSGAPVREITERFNAVCFGGETADPAVLETLRRALEGAIRA